LENDNELSGCQRDYLSLIQGVINRMASSSVTIKGFAATIFAGVLAIFISNHSNQSMLALLIAIVAILVAFLFDWYYFYHEKQYRLLYDEVRVGVHPCNFEMGSPKYAQIKRRNALKSFSLWAYYGTLESTLLLTVFCSLL
jgi:hypothetical protein